jgi:CspA family cold shock protein
MATTNGTISKLTDKGFGFITGSDGKEYFFHQSALVGAQFDGLRQGQSVTFDVGQGPKGPRAENVRVG